MEAVYLVVVVFPLEWIAKGYITVEVLRDILHELDDKISSSDLDLMIDEIDADGSGKFFNSMHFFGLWLSLSWELCDSDYTFFSFNFLFIF